MCLFLEGLKCQEETDLISNLTSEKSSHLKIRKAFQTRPLFQHKKSFSAARSSNNLFLEDKMRVVHIFYMKGAKNSSCTHCPGTLPKIKTKFQYPPNLEFLKTLPKCNYPKCSEIAPHHSHLWERERTFCILNDKQLKLFFSIPPRGG